MSDPIEVISILLPDIALIALGATLAGRIAGETWGGIDRLNFLVLFPALLFVSAAGRPIAPATNFGSFLTFALIAANSSPWSFISFVVSAAAPVSYG